MFRTILLFSAGFGFGNALLLSALREFGKHEIWSFAGLSVLVSGFVGFAFGFSFDRPTSSLLVRSVFVAIAVWYLWSLLLTYGMALIGLPAIAVVVITLFAGRLLGDRLTSRPCAFSS
ncbi:MAG: hypothetical protein PHI64_08595 [Zoogloea sp.]|uniref:hypothetical protein n=1 Tax=Zoogloea sp. TaxID=49181 RepID=UPI002604B835|nr:hypothetical protein [Zoogloea sp.]MDD2989005.1 hypothetical protein [Zoogloea sp.]